MKFYITFEKQDEQYVIHQEGCRELDFVQKKKSIGEYESIEQAKVEISSLFSNFVFCNKCIK